MLGVTGADALSIQKAARSPGPCISGMQKVAHAPPILYVGSELSPEK